MIDLILVVLGVGLVVGGIVGFGKALEWFLRD
jgi:hypothetical protein